MFNINVNDTNVRMTLPVHINVKEAAALRDTTTDLAKQGCLNFVFDFSDVKQMDTTGLGVLVNLSNIIAHKNGGYVKVIGATGTVDELFARTRLKDTFCC